MEEVDLTDHDLRELLSSLPACHRCRKNKRRCDTQLPSCSNCSKADVECMFFDHVLGENLPRSYIASLLQCLVQTPEGVDHDLGDPLQSNQNLSFDHLSSEQREIDHQRQHRMKSDRYLGSLSCLSQCWNIYDSSVNGEIPSGIAPSIPKLGDTFTIQNDVHQFLLEKYFCEIHPIYPILDESLSFLSPQSFPEGDLPPWKRFLLELVYSIACHCVAQDNYLLLGEECHRRALKYIDHATGDLTIKTLQAITLLALHSLFDPQKGNFGQLIGFAARLAIDIGRHDTPDQELRLQNIYSSIYCMENQFSTVLDRPSFLPEPMSPLNLDLDNTSEYVCSLYRLQSRIRNNLNTTYQNQVQSIDISALERRIYTENFLSPNILSTVYETRLLLESNTATASALLNVYTHPRFIYTFLTQQWAYRAGLITLEARFKSSSTANHASSMDTYGKCLMVLERASSRWPGAIALSQSLQTFARERGG